jgi:hypothetical protein
MKIQAKDCAAGGNFQMEVERGDGTRTRITHTLVQNNRSLTPFYFDNPNFRAHEGEFLGDDCTSIETGRSQRRQVPSTEPCQGPSGDTRVPPVDSALISI